MFVLVGGKVYDSHETPIVVRFTDSQRADLKLAGMGKCVVIGSAPYELNDKTWKKGFRHACKILAKAEKRHLALRAANQYGEEADKLTGKIDKLKS